MLNRFLGSMGMVVVITIVSACGDPLHTADDGGLLDTETETSVDTAVSIWDPPKNVILFIGDGMGAPHADAAALMLHGETETLSFESFPVKGMMTVHAANSDLPDSASSATAMAAGVKVNLEVISMAIPGDGHALPTLVDFYHHQQKSTGLVSTCTVTDATPAAFAAHTADRYNTIEIGWHYFHTGRPNILFGGGGHGIDLVDAESLGYTVIHTLDGFDDLLDGEAPYISGQFGTENFSYEADGIGDLPHLSEMTAAALTALAQNENGFFAMVEGGRIDDAAHVNDLRRVVYEVIEFDNTIAAALDVLDLAETLVIVTADHSTGELEITADNGIGELPEVTWSSAQHDPMPVPFFAVGKGAEAFASLLDRNGGVIDNTDIYHVLTALPTVESAER